MSTAPHHFDPTDRIETGMASARRRLAFPGGDITPKTMRDWQTQAREAIAGLIRLPVNDHAPTAPRRLWQRQTTLGVIEKIVFQAEPGADVPAYWCRPHGLQPPYPVFICLQGHSQGMYNSVALDPKDESTSIDVPGDRDFAVSAMKHGYAALAIEQRCFGEREEAAHLQYAHQQFEGSRCHNTAVRSMMLGRTLIGDRVFDVDRAIDYLVDRDDVDVASIGVMGQSGGATTACFAAATLDRVMRAMASCYVCHWRDSIMRICHCTCNYVPCMLELIDCPDVLAAFAPRPLVVVAGREDPIFPIDSARSAMREIAAAYAVLGSEAHLAFVEGDGGHRFYADDAWAAMKQVCGGNG